MGTWGLEDGLVFREFDSMWKGTGFDPQCQPNFYLLLHRSRFQYKKPRMKDSAIIWIITPHIHTVSKYFTQYIIYRALHNV